VLNVQSRVGAACSPVDYIQSITTVILHEEFNRKDYYMMLSATTAIA